MLIKFEEFKGWKYVSLGINITALYFLVCKFVFNLFTKKKKTMPIKFDFWTQVDVCSAILTIVTMNLITNSDPQLFVSVPNRDEATNYFITFVQSSWKSSLNFLVTFNTIL